MAYVLPTADLDVVAFAATPSAPAVTSTNGVAGHYTYKLVGIDSAGNHSAVSAGTAITDGPTALSATDFTTIDPTAAGSPGAVSFDVYRTAGGATQGKIGNVLNDGIATLDDTGLVADGTTAPATNTSGFGNAFDCSSMFEKGVYVSGTFTATFKLQASADGSTWLPFSSNVTGATIVEVLVPVMFLRVAMSAYTSGTPAVQLLGWRSIGSAG